MYEKSGAMLGVARLLPPEDPRRALLLKAVKNEIETAGKLMFETNYGDTHWLASSAMYYSTASGL